MLVRNLDFLSIPKEFSKVEIDIYEKQSIALVYIPNKGYSLVLKDNDDIQSVFLLKTDILPNNNLVETISKFRLTSNLFACFLKIIPINHYF